MKKKTLLKTFIPLIIFFSIAIFGKENSTDEFIIGQVEFIGKSSKEGIVVLNAPGKAYLLNKGVLLFIKRGKEQLVLKIDDVDGKYFKCTIDNKASAAVVNYGEDVYYSDSMNSSVKYRDAKRLFSELIRLYENFILKVESTENVLKISEAIKDFSQKLDRLIPEMKRINSKYPELEKFNVSPPAELMDESVMLEVLGSRLKDAFFKIKIYSSDENVKKATDDLQKVLSKMNTGR